MRSTLAILLLGGCTSPTNTGDDGRTPFIPDPSSDDSGTDTGMGRVHRVEPGPASLRPYESSLGTDLGRPWIDTAGDVPVFDCSLVPKKPTEINELDEPRGYHDVIFDTEGNLIGSDGYNLIASSDPSSSTIWVPNAGDVQGMDWLPDGDLVAASGSAIVRFNPEAGRSVITSNIYGYGVTVGPDGMVYVGGMASVMKLDPESGDVDVFFDSARRGDAARDQLQPRTTRGCTSARSRARRRVYAVDLDEDLEPVDEGYLFADGVGGGYHDGMGVDVCGNVYVNDYNTFSFYRVSPVGEVSLLQAWSWADGGYGHGQDWGSGLSVWRTDAIYVPQPYDGNTVAEVVVGIPSTEVQQRHVRRDQRGEVGSEPIRWRRRSGPGR